MLYSTVRQGETAQAAFSAISNRPRETFTILPKIHNQYTCDNAWRLREILHFIALDKEDTWFGAQLYYAMREAGVEDETVRNIYRTLYKGEVACFPERNGFYTFVWKVSDKG